MLSLSKLVKISCSTVAVMFCCTATSVVAADSVSPVTVHRNPVGQTSDRRVRMILINQTEQKPSDCFFVWLKGPLLQHVYTFQPAGNRWQFVRIDSMPRAESTLACDITVELSKRSFDFSEEWRDSLMRQNTLVDVREAAYFCSDLIHSLLINHPQPGSFPTPSDYLRETYKENH
jgi:hypothetical protein